MDLAFLSPVVGSTKEPSPSSLASTFSTVPTSDWDASLSLICDFSSSVRLSNNTFNSIGLRAIVIPRLGLAPVNSLPLRSSWLPSLTVNSLVLFPTPFGVG